MRIDPGPAPEPVAVALETDVSHEVMTATEVAVALRIPLRTVYDLADTGEIPCFRVGRRRMFLRETIDLMKDPGRAKEDTPEGLMTAVQVSEELKVPHRTVLDQAAKGGLPSVRFGPRVMFLRETIEAIKAQGRMPDPVDI